MPPLIEEAIRVAYDRLNKEIDLNRDVDVAVRSSATAEDLPDASFAGILNFHFSYFAHSFVCSYNFFFLLGQQETFLNVCGFDSLIDSCRRCFASLFTDRAISYRQTKTFDHFTIGLSIGVQLVI
jgi:pyruvate,water dikinase